MANNRRGVVFFLAVPLAWAGTTLTTLTSASPTVTYGASLALTASIAPATATGTVTFYDDGTVLGTAKVISGKANLSPRFLPAGNRKLRAIYSGDTGNNSSVSAIVPTLVKTIPGTGFTVVPNLSDTGTTAAAVISADFNGDGKADLAVANSDSNDVAILLGKGDGTFQKAVSYPAGTTPVALAASDLNGDGFADLVVANSASGNLTFLFGNGDGTFARTAVFTVQGVPSAVTISDFNSDGFPDLAWTNGASTIGVALGNGDGTFRPPVNLLVGAGPKAIAAGDFNGDGIIDLVTGNTGARTINILLGKGDGTFLPSGSSPAGDFCVSIALADFNGDSKLDVAVVGGVQGARVLLGNGDGSFRASATWQPAGFGIVTTDLNGDGKLDLVTAGPDIEQSFGNGDGSFQPLSAYQTPTSSLFGLAVADFNGDGRADIVTANGPDSNLTVLLGAPFAITGVSNAAGGGVNIQSGSWVAIYGSGLSLTTRTWQAPDFIGSALPTSLDGVKVTIDNKPAAVFFISPEQVNVQAPADTATGNVTVQVINSYGVASGSATLQPWAPAFFGYLGKYPVAVHLDGTFVAPVNAFGSTVATRPAKPGETIILFGTGFGPTSPAIAPGQIVTGFANLADPTALRIRIGGNTATVPFAGLVAAGEFQFNVVVPLGLSNGDQALVADIGGQITQSPLFIPVQN